MITTRAGFISYESIRLNISAFIAMNIVQSIDEFHLPKTQSQVIRLQFLDAILYEGSNRYKYLLQGRNSCHVDILDYSTQTLSKLLQNH